MVLLQIIAGSLVKMNWFKELYDKIDVYFSKDENIVIEQLKKLNKNYKHQLGVRQAELLELNNNINILQEELNAIHKEKKFESYWNNVRSKTKITYPAREGIWSDPRMFLGFDHSLYYPTVGNNDDKAKLILDYVARKITYTSDEKENWQFAYETWERKKGDCEDGAILMAVMMLNSGIPYWRIRLNAGNVQGGGHAYVTYLREFDNQWYILDWCYWYAESKNFSKLWKEAEKYFGIWFSVNQKYCYGVTPTKEDIK